MRHRECRAAEIKLCADPRSGRSKVSAKRWGRFHQQGGGRPVDLERLSCRQLVPGMSSLESARSVFPFLTRLSSDQWSEFARAAKPVSLDPGALICLEGDHCQALPLVLSGEARVYRTSSSGRALTLYRIAAGESCILTASCLLSGLPFPAFAEAETPVDALLIPADAFADAFRHVEPWREHIFELLARRLANVIELVDAVAFQRVDERLASHLVDQADADGRVVRTHEMLAEALGTSREVVSRALKEFERQGLVELARGEVGLVDAPGLQRYGFPGAV